MDPKEQARYDCIKAYEAEIKAYEKTLSLETNEKRKRELNKYIIMATVQLIHARSGEDLMVRELRKNNKIRW